MERCTRTDKRKKGCATKASDGSHSARNGGSVEEER
jgi:hypothetical protein